MDKYMTDTLNLVKAFSYGVLVPLFTYTQLSQELVLILSVMLLLDIATGIIRECIIGKLKSREITKGVISKMLLLMVPFILIMVGKGAGIDMSPIAKLVISTFIIAEGYSTIGNIIQIRLKDKTIGEQDAITMVLQKAQQIISSLLEGIMTKK